MKKVKVTMNVCVEIFQYSRSILASSGQDIAEVVNPMKMFEYMAAGRAIVCAELPVIREVLDEGNAVFVESSGELENQRIGNWRLAIESLLADESRRLALGAQARRDVERFSWVRRNERVMEGMAV